MTLDERSERNLATLHPDLHHRAATFVAAAKSLATQRGLDVKCICGLRTWAEQAALYAKGRTTSGPIVTRAPAGHSMHNFGLAVDLAVFSKDGKTYHGDHALYRELGPLGESLGFEWGGRWKFNDEPHYQFRPAWAKNMSERETLAALRIRIANKLDILA
jgi:peptidoglycan L-alanyl-D-glutamate endopeptidase CwlK